MWSNELKFFFAFEQFIMLLNINPVKKMFEEIFFLFMKSEMRTSMDTTFKFDTAINVDCD